MYYQWGSNMNFNDAPETQFAASRERRGGLAGPPGGAQIRARAADAAGRAAHEVVREKAPEAAKKNLPADRTTDQD